jgi:hypothetical protein
LISWFLKICAFQTGQLVCRYALETKKKSLGERDFKVGGLYTAVGIQLTHSA